MEKCNGDIKFSYVTHVIIHLCWNLERAMQLPHTDRVTIEGNKIEATKINKSNKIFKMCLPPGFHSERWI